MAKPKAPPQAKGSFMGAVGKFCDRPSMQAIAKAGSDAVNLTLLTVTSMAVGATLAVNNLNLS